VRLVDDGGGLGFVLIGVIRSARAHSRHLRLPDPAQRRADRYGEAFVAGRAATMTFNIFASFRGGEAAYTCARTLAMCGTCSAPSRSASINIS